MQFIGENEIKLLRCGHEYFPALESAIEHACDDIYLQAYIYENDIMGMRIGHALMQAAQRGVNVHVLLDGFGSQYLPADFIQTLRAAGVKLMFYRPKISPWTLKKNRLRRLHSKVTVIDSTIAFVGGINIIDDHNSPHQVPPRIDHAVRIEGPLLPVICGQVQKLWRRLAWLHLRQLDRPVSRKTAATHHGKGSSSAAFIIRDNILHRHDIEDAYLHAINTARTEILIANAYFIPGRKFRKALVQAVRRGVRVRLLLQGRKEYFLMFATHAFYNEFLHNGIEIHEYRKSFMHSKVAVFDHELATVGSSNIDPFSLLLAREANIFVQDPTFAAALHADIAHMIEDGGVKITQQSWYDASIIRRIASWIAYGAVRWLLGMIGYKETH